MLRRLNVRMRLVAVLVVPFALLLLVAVPVATERRDTANAADHAANLTSVSADLGAVAAAIQDERTLAAAVRAGAGDDLRALLATQRTATDETVERTRNALRFLTVTTPAVSDAVADVTTHLDGLDGVRAETDVAQSIVPWVDPFAPLLAAVLDLHEAVVATITDGAVRDGLTEVALLARSTDAAAAQSAQLAAAAVWGELRGDQVGILSRLRADEEALRTAHLAASPGAQRVERRAAVNAGAVTSADRLVDAVLRSASPEAIGSLASWLPVSEARQDALRAVEVDLTGRAQAIARAAGDEARAAARAYVLLAGGGLLLGVGLALLAARSITKPLGRLTAAADHLAEERLPQLVDALRHPGEHDERFLAATAEPLDARSDDELGRLARAFNTVQSVAVDVAAAQADLLRKGISDLFVNLARRNQSLLERQIRLLDHVEREDQAPEVLQHLYELDHLATRMRRNAESLLVLAGAEPDRRRAAPVAAVDVIRAAVGEVEQYGRVELGVMADAVLRGAAVSDVAHIVAELLDNATHFSPPDTSVRIEGRRSGTGYQIVIVDQGVGMPASQLEELNVLLREPPVTGLALGRALGCLVAARLAARHDIGIRLTAGDAGGLVATVTLPSRLVQEEAPPTDELILDELERDVAAASAVDDDDAWLLEWGDAAGPVTIGPMADPAPWDDEPLDDVRPARSADPTVPAATLQDALPDRATLDADLDALLDRQQATPLAPPVTAEPPSPTPPVTASGLVRRVPRAAGGALPTTTSEPARRRSPDEVRTMLARYRTGLQAGRDGTTAAPEE